MRVQWPVPMALLGLMLAPAQTVPRMVLIPEVPYLASSTEVVDGMLKLAAVNRSDTVYDLGCGDGRIVITAAKEFNARGVGIDIDSERIRQAREKAEQAGVEPRVRFEVNDLFAADIHEATVIMLYLLPSVNVRLRPKLLKELRPGTRIVSHSFDMGEWKPDREVEVDGHPIYLWTVPATHSLRGFQP